MALPHDKDVTSAIIIMPPEHMWTQIQNVRMTHDKAYARWMPHINLIFPFVTETAFTQKKILEKLSTALSSVAPFTVEFSSFDFFEHSKNNCTLYCKPSATPEIVNVQKRIWDVIPECNDQNTKSESGFHPHLTMGQFTKARIPTMVKSISAKWTPIKWVVDRVYIIRRSKTSAFSIHHEVQFQQSKPASIAPVLAAHVEPVQETVVEKVQIQVKQEVKPLKSFSVEKKEKKEVIFDFLVEEKEEEPVQQAQPKVNLEDLFSSLSLNKTVKDLHPEIKEIILRIIEWIQLLRSQGQGLPKNAEKFQKAICSKCFIQGKVNFEVIYQRLIDEEFITVSGNSVTLTNKRKTVRKENYRSQNENRGILKSGSFSSYYTDNFVALAPDDKQRIQMSYDRAVLWVISSAASNFKLESFKSQLTQLCEFKIFVSPSDITQTLQTLKLITAEYSFEKDSFEYNL